MLLANIPRGKYLAMLIHLTSEELKKSVVYPSYSAYKPP